MGRELRCHDVEENSTHPTVQRTQQSAEKQPFYHTRFKFFGWNARRRWLAWRTAAWTRLPAGRSEGRARCKRLSNGSVLFGLFENQGLGFMTAASGAGEKPIFVRLVRKPRSAFWFHLEVQAEHVDER